MRNVRRLKMAAACYVGLAVLVALFVAAAEVLPTGVGLPLLIVAAGAIVAVGHPQVRALVHRAR